MLSSNNNYEFIESEAYDMEVDLSNFTSEEAAWLYTHLLIHWLGGTKSTRQLYFNWLVARHGFTAAKAYKAMQAGEKDFATLEDNEKLAN